MSFRLPTRVVIEPGAVSTLSRHLNEYPADRALLLFDAGLARTHWPRIVHEQLNRSGIGVIEFDEVEPNPRVETVDQAAKIARLSEVELVVGIGGGSVLDAAKAVSMLLSNRGGIAKYEGRNLFSEAAAPFVAIPTTCGTGSEVTWVSVLSDPSTRRKISVKGDKMFPALAVVDADVLETLPVALIAQTGLDAITHAIESIVVRCSNPVSDTLARDAIDLILTSLAPLVNDPADPLARERVMRASTLAGMAFGNSDVGAVHCLSESIGGLLDLGHGLLNAILLLPVLRFQFDSIADRLGTISPEVGAREFLARVEDLTAQVEIPSFASLNIPAEMFDEIATMAEMNGSNASNRMDFQGADYRLILDGLSA